MTALKHLAALLPALAIVIAAPTSNDSAAVLVPRVKWAPCAEPETVQCANYTVPIDYHDPSVGTANIAMVRVKSSRVDPKGTIFLNPGGPGGSGTKLLLDFLESPDFYPAMKLLADYHLIGLDPRGVGKSTPVRCNPRLWNRSIPSMVSNEAEYKRFSEHWQQVGESCRSLTGPLLDHLDTMHVVRDFERILAAIGEDKFNLVGLSYGTQIGYTFAEQFPCKTGRLVLDGVLDHTQQGLDTVQTESLSYEQTLQQFFKWCDQKHTSCAIREAGFHSSEVFFTDLVAQVRHTPLLAPACNETAQAPCKSQVTLEDFLTNVQGGLPGGPQYGWPDLSQKLVSASKGDASLLSTPYHVEDTDPVGGAYASLAIGCADWNRAHSYVELHNAEIVTNALSPITLGYTQSMGYFSRCALWPAKTTNPQRALRESHLSRAPCTILLANTFWDPETSVQWATSMRHQIPQSTLVYRNGSGHTSYGMPGEMADVMTKFMLTGELPKDGSIYQS